MSRIKVTTSWDDASLFDLKLVNLLRKYHIPATFYIPISNKERECLSSSEIKKIAKYFDIGAHSFHHINLTRIPLEEAKREILESRRRLEEITGKKPRMFCYPYGAYDERIVSIVKLANFLGARTDKCSETRVDNPFRLGTTVHACDCTKFHYIKEAIFSKNFGLSSLLLRTKLGKSWVEIAKTTLNYVIKNGGVWHLRGHSWEIEQNDDWGNLEQVLKILANLRKSVNCVAFLDNSQLIARYM